MKGTVPFCLYDFQHHLSSIQTSYVYLKEGQINHILPSIMTESFGSFGYPLTLIYPIFTFLPEIFIHVIVGNAWLSYVVFTGICFFLIMLSMFFCAKGIGISKFSSLFSALLYGFAPFALYNMLSGSNDISAAMVMIFLPIVFYGLYQTLLGDRKKWWVLSIGMFLIVITHLLSLVLTSVLIVFLLGMVFFNNDSVKQRIKRLLGVAYAAVTTILLSLFFLAPLAQIMFYTGTNQQAVQIQRGDWPLIKYSLTPLNFLLPNTQLTTGLNFLFFIALIFILLSFKKLPKLFKYLSFVLAIFSLLSTNIFPWAVFQGMFSIIQMPIRFLFIVEFLIVIILGKSLDIFISNKSNNKYLKPLIITGLLLLGLFTTANALTTYRPTPNQSYMTNQQIQEGENGIISTSKLSQLAGEAPNLEWISKDSSPIVNNLFQHSIPKMNPNVKGLKQSSWKTAYNKITYSLYSNNKQKGISIPNLYFPGFQISDNGKHLPMSVGKEKEIKLPLQKGRNNIQVSYKKTRVRILSGWISLISWVVLVLILLIQYFKKRNYENAK